MYIIKSRFRRYKDVIIAKFAKFKDVTSVSPEAVKRVEKDLNDGSVVAFYEREYTSIIYSKKEKEKHMTISNPIIGVKRWEVYYAIHSIMGLQSNDVLFFGDFEDTDVNIVILYIPGKTNRKRD